MQVVIPPQDFDFATTSVMSSPYSTGPPTPKRFGDYFYSAPTSPSRLSDFYRAFDEEFPTDIYATRSPPPVPYEWEFNPGRPKVTKISNYIDHYDDDDGGDFAFDFSEDLERTSLSADELFDGGKIKPLKLQQVERVAEKRNQNSASSIRSPRSPGQKKGTKERGRERISNNSAAAESLSVSRSGRRATRSLSPLRASQYPWEEGSHDQKQEAQQKVTNANNKPQLAANLSKPSSSKGSSSSSSSSRKWRLRDFLLFRSASEGRATDKDPLRKYHVLYGKKHDHHQDVSKNGIFRSTESFGSGQRRKGAPAVSAHERHYTANKAASEDLKKKTFLPYKQGILGRLAFNPSLHALANGFGTFTRSS